MLPIYSPISSIQHEGDVSLSVNYDDAQRKHADTYGHYLLCDGVDTKAYLYLTREDFKVRVAGGPGVGSVPCRRFVSGRSLRGLIRRLGTNNTGIFIKILSSLVG